MGTGTSDRVSVTITGEAERKDQKVSMWFVVQTIVFAFAEDIVKGADLYLPKNVKIGSIFHQKKKFPRKEGILFCDLIT